MLRKTRGSSRSLFSYGCFYKDQDDDGCPARVVINLKEMLEIIKFNFLIYIDYLKYILLNIIAHNDKYKLFMKHKRMVVI